MGKVSAVRPEVRSGSWQFTYRTGYSLIEILITVAILVALILLTVPVIEGVMRGGERAASIQNLRAISAMGELYGVDHNGDGFPYESTEWGTVLTGGSVAYMFEFLPRIYGDENYNAWRRPGDDLKIPKGGMRILGNRIPWSYARNISLPQKKGMPRLDNTYKKNLLPHLSKTMLLLETHQNAGLTYNADSQIYFDDKEFCAVVFVDGHAELVSKERMVGQSVSAPASWPAERRTLWFGFPDATTRRDY